MHDKTWPIQLNRKNLLKVETVFALLCYPNKITFTNQAARQPVVFCMTEEYLLDRCGSDLLPRHLVSMTVAEIQDRFRRRWPPCQLESSAMSVCTWHTSLEAQFVQHL